MFTKKFYRYFLGLSSIASLLFFLFLQFVNYSDTTSQHILLEQDYSWQAHWDFFMTQENFYVFIFCFVLGFIPLVLTLLIDKWIYSKFKKSS